MFLSTDIRVGIKARVDSPLIAKQIFNTFIYPHQLYIIAISSNLRKFFNKNNINSISFWDFSSNNKQPPYLLVNKKLKHYKINSILSSKSSWKFNRREECNSIVKKWQMYFLSVKNKRSGLNIFLFSSLIFIFFLIYFPLFYFQN